MNTCLVTLVLVVLPVDVNYDLDYEVATIPAGQALIGMQLEDCDVGIPGVQLRDPGASCMLITEMSNGSPELHRNVKCRRHRYADKQRGQGSGSQGDGG